MQETILGGQLDIAHADIRAAAGSQIEARGQGCGQLQVRRRAVVEVDAALAGARLRLRPILMTSLATLIGLLPMALKLGEGSESYAPLAQALIGGLTVSVLLTIFLVPAGFLLVYRESA